MKHKSIRCLGVIVVLFVCLGVGSAATGASIETAGGESPFEFFAQSKVPSALTDGEEEAAVSGALTHLAMLRGVVRSATGEMLAGMTLPPGEALTVIASRAHGANWLVSDELANILSREGYRVRIEKGVLEAPTPSAPPPSEVPSHEVEVDPDEDLQEWPDDPLFEDELEEGAEDSTGTEDDFGSDWDDDGETESDPDDILGTLMEMKTTTGVGATEVAGSGQVDPVTQALELSGPVLEFRVIECAVKYIGVHRAFFLGPKRVERAARVDLSCRLIDGESREVQWVGGGDGIAVDKISKSKLPLYESSGFTPAALEEPGALRYVEPVLVGGIVAGLVYLFYTNQD